MPSVSPSAWGPKPTFVLSSGLPAVGYKLFAYIAGSVGTKQATYDDSTGLVANTNPVILDVNGQPTGEWWWQTSLTYKIVFAPAADTDPPTSPIWTVDNVRGIGDATITPSEWVASSLVPTYISATSFSLVGDQTAIFQVGRRLKSTNTAGTIYSTIASSVFTTVTTVTVVNDSGVLDSGLSAVSYGIISAINTSDPFATPASAGDVDGPASSTDGHFAQFDGTTGKLIRDGGVALDTDGTLAANSDTRVASQKAVKTYVDASAAAAQPYELGGSYTGAPTASAVLLRAPMCRTVSFAAGLSPSHGVAGTAATAQTDFDLLKNGVSFGTMRFAASGTVASFISASGSTPGAGDVITVVAPASPDATLANIGFILAGTR